MGLKILDCTIRDGGHLNKWHFSQPCVKASYFAALKSGMDYFEIGYRCPATVTGLGEFGYCTDDFLFSLFTASDKCKLTVMIDAGKSDTSLFARCTPDNTPVKAVRVAAYPYELAKAFHLLEDLKEKGYEVFLNLMASSELNPEQLAQLNSWGERHILEAVCFADSFGSFIPSDIPAHVATLRGLGFTSIGFHPHNNLQMSFANTLRAIEEGVSVVDASIFGMGRGSGNLPIEVLVGYLEKQGDKGYNTVPYLDVIERFYLDLFKQLNWGYKIQSLMGGLKNIHPYYIDDLFRRKNYTVDEIWNALDIVKESCPISYSVDKLNQALESRFYTPLTPEKAQAACAGIGDQLEIIAAADSFEAEVGAISGRHAGRKFVIVANGPSVLEKQAAIEKFIADENAVTIGLNYLPKGFVPDYHIMVSRKRFLKYACSVSEKSVLLVPSFFGRELVEQNYGGSPLFFNLENAANGEAPVERGNLHLEYLNVAAAAIALAFEMGGAEIYGVGMDGYIDEMNKGMVYFYNENDVPDDKDVASLRYERLAAELERVNAFLQEESVPFSIITPTSHKKYYRNILG
ncbi:MAG TPA: hypothetical protein DCZ75_14455 [Geobacter sp.]|nr:hypothetical protein [Geobacter sp.]